MIAYDPQLWKPQWKNVQRMASSADSFVPPSPNAGSTYIKTGSATPQKNKLIASPALYNIAIQVNILNSGRSVSLPRRIFPYLEKAANKQMTTNVKADSI